MRRLHTRHGRRKEGAFVLEGARAIQDALAAAPEHIEAVYLAEHPLDPELVERAAEAGVECVAVPPDVFATLSQLDAPPGALAVATARYAELEPLLTGDGVSPRAVVACLGVQDPGNLGSILRSAAFFGFAGAVVLRGGADPYHPRLVRGSSGTLLAAPPARAADWPELAAAARAAGLTPVALVAHGGQELERLPARTLLLLGAEGPGVAPEVSAASQLLTLRGSTESLNVAAAFAVGAHLWVRSQA